MIKHFRTKHFGALQRAGRRSGRIAAAGSLLLLAALAGCGRSGTDQNNADWAHYGNEANEQRFSGLTQIDAASVGRLGLEWSLDLPGEWTLEGTPLEVGGVLYFSTGAARVYAVDAKTGKTLWRYEPDYTGFPLESRIMYAANRGVAYGDGRIFVTTKDGRMIAIDAKTGKPAWIKSAALPGKTMMSTGAPRYFKGKVIIGNSGAEQGARGYVTAFDAKTGAVLWRFFTVPGNPATDTDETTRMASVTSTWSGEWWKYGGGGTPWSGITFDEDFNQILIGTGNGGPWLDEFRMKGVQDNLFVSSIVAVDADTGRYKWHHQYNPGEIWDYKATSEMILADLKVEGKDRKVVIQAPSDAFIYVLDRATGKLLAADAYGKQNWAKGIDMKTGRPIEVPEARYKDKPFTIYPGMSGAHSWEAASYNPQTGLVYIPYIQHGTTYWRSTDEAHWVEKPFKTGFSRLGVAAMPIVVDPKDPADGKGQLIAWDPVKRKVAWRVVQDTMYNGGTVTTAGGLVFQGLASGDLVAYDARTGKRVWSFNAGLGIIAPPITYAVDGKQYVSVLVGFGGTGGEGMHPVTIAEGWGGAHVRRLLTFALDGKGKLEKAPRIDPMTLQVLDKPSLRFDQKRLDRAFVFFHQSCSSCHGGFAISTGAAPDLRASGIAANAEGLKAYLHQGNIAQGMPPFPDLDDEDVEDIFQYIRSEARKAKNKTSY